MAVELTLTQLVRNGTMSPEMADTLMVAARSRSSLLFFAGPRLAGKTTTLRATLAYVPEGTPVHEVSADEPDLGIPAQPDGGYLLVHEFAETPVFPTYIWGEPVRRVFDALATGGLSLAAATHADSLEEAFDKIAANGVPDGQAGLIDYAVHIRSLGDWREPTRRVVAALYQLRPDREARLLHRWDEATNRFEVMT